MHQNDIYYLTLESKMDSYLQENKTHEQESIDSPTGLSKGNEDSVEPPSKRVCTPVRQSNIEVQLDEFQEAVNMKERPLSIPRIHVDQINVRHPGSVNHEYGNGHQQLNISHCAPTMGNQHDIKNLSMPHLFVQPNYNERNINTQQFDRQVVSYDSNHFHTSKMRLY